MTRSMGQHRYRATRVELEDLPDAVRFRGYLETGIRSLPAAKKELRRRFNLGCPAPIVSRPGTRYYVTVRSGRAVAVLLGPYVSPMTAQANVERAQRIARERAPSASAFGAFGVEGTTNRLYPGPAVWGR